MSLFLDPILFDNCGLVKPGERGNRCAGDDVIVPSVEYAQSTRGFHS